MAKLTLSVEPDKIAMAKRYASKHHTSISKLFSDFIANVTVKDEVVEEDLLLAKIKQMEIPDWIKKLSVTPKVDLPDDVDYKELKYEYLKERYGL
jgi:hypothetical protein